MPKIPYPKQIQNFACQIGILKQRGMTFVDESSQPATGTQRVYFVLTIVRYWLNIIDPQNTLTQDLQQLFSEFPSVHAGVLGFPQNWEQESLWQ